MSKAILAFVVTIITGLMGFYMGAAINAEGYIGIIFSIATMGAFIISAIENHRVK